MPRRKPKKTPRRKRKTPSVNEHLRAIERFDRKGRRASMAYSVAWLEGRR